MTGILAGGSLDPVGQTPERLHTTLRSLNKATYGHIYDLLFPSTSSSVSSKPLTHLFAIFSHAFTGQAAESGPAESSLKGSGIAIKQSALTLLATLLQSNLPTTSQDTEGQHDEERAGKKQEYQLPDMLFRTLSIHLKTILRLPVSSATLKFLHALFQSLTAGRSMPSAKKAPIEVHKLFQQVRWQEILPLIKQHRILYIRLISLLFTQLPSIVIPQPSSKSSDLNTREYQQSLMQHQKRIWKGLPHDRPQIVAQFLQSVFVFIRSQAQTEQDKQPAQIKHTKTLTTDEIDILIRLCLDDSSTFKDETVEIPASSDNSMLTSPSSHFNNSQLALAFLTSVHPFLSQRLSAQLLRKLPIGDNVYDVLADQILQRQPSLIPQFWKESGIIFNPALTMRFLSHCAFLRRATTYELRLPNLQSTSNTPQALQLIAQTILDHTLPSSFALAYTKAFQQKSPLVQYIAMMTLTSCFVAFVKARDAILKQSIAESRDNAETGMLSASLILLKYTDAAFAQRVPNLLGTINAARSHNSPTVTEIARKALIAYSKEIDNMSHSEAPTGQLDSSSLAFEARKWLIEQPSQCANDTDEGHRHLSTSHALLLLRQTEVDLFSKQGKSLETVGKGPALIIFRGVTQSLCSRLLSLSSSHDQNLAQTARTVLQAQIMLNSPLCFQARPSEIEDWLSGLSVRAMPAFEFALNRAVKTPYRYTEQLQTLSYNFSPVFAAFSEQVTHLLQKQGRDHPDVLDCLGKVIFVMFKTLTETEDCLKDLCVFSERLGLRPWLEYLSDVHRVPPDLNLLIQKFPSVLTSYLRNDDNIESQLETAKQENVTLVAALAKYRPVSLKTLSLYNYCLRASTNQKTKHLTLNDSMLEAYKSGNLMTEIETLINTHLDPLEQEDRHLVEPFHQVASSCKRYRLLAFSDLQFIKQTPAEIIETSQAILQRCDHQVPFNAVKILHQNLAKILGRADAVDHIKLVHQIFRAFEPVILDAASHTRLSPALTSLDMRWQRYCLFISARTNLGNLEQLKRLTTVQTSSLFDSAYLLSIELVTSSLTELLRKGNWMPQDVDLLTMCFSNMSPKHLSLQACHAPDQQLILPIFHKALATLDACYTNVLVRISSLLKDSDYHRNSDAIYKYMLSVSDSTSSSWLLYLTQVCALRKDYGNISKWLDLFFKAWETSKTKADMLESLIKVLQILPNDQQLSPSKQMAVPFLTSLCTNRISKKTLEAIHYLLSHIALPDGAIIRVGRHLFMMFTARDLVNDEALSLTLLKALKVSIDQAPHALYTIENLALLLPLYGARLNKHDSLILEIIMAYETQKGRSIQALLFSYDGRGIPLRLDRSPHKSLSVLDADDILATARNFPRHLSMSDSKLIIPQEGCADPRFVLPLLANALSGPAPTKKQWSDILRSNVISMAIASLSSAREDMRSIGEYCLRRCRHRLQASTLNERYAVGLVLDWLRNVTDQSVAIQPELPGVMTFFASQFLSTIWGPHKHLYLMGSRFLLQRSIAEVNDVPLLYNLLNSDEEHASESLEFLFQMISVGTQKRTEWRILNRRHVIDILLGLTRSSQLSMAQKSEALSVIGGLAKRPLICVKLIRQTCLLPWIAQALDQPTLQPLHHDLLRILLRVAISCKSQPKITVIIGEILEDALKTVDTSLMSLALVAETNAHLDKSQGQWILPEICSQLRTLEQASISESDSALYIGIIRDLFKSAERTIESAQGITVSPPGLSSPIPMATWHFIVARAVALKIIPLRAIS